MSEVVKVKGIPMELNGVTRIVPPLALGALEQLQDRLQGFNDPTDLKQVGVVIDAAHAALKRNYPSITREEVGEAIGLEQMEDVFLAVMDVSGLRRKSLEAAAAEVGAGEA